MGFPSQVIVPKIADEIRWSHGGSCALTTPSPRRARGRLYYRNKRLFRALKLHSNAGHLIWGELTGASLNEALTWNEANLKKWKALFFACLRRVSSSSLRETINR